MKFRARRSDEPEIMLIPMIDVMLVLVIFLVATTSFVNESRLRVELPEASIRASNPESRRVEVGIDAEGLFSVGDKPAGSSAETLRAVLGPALAADPEARFVIRADARTPHQAVVTAMDVAGQLGVRAIGIAALPKPGE